MLCEGCEESRVPAQAQLLRGDTDVAGSAAGRCKTRQKRRIVEKPPNQAGSVETPRGMHWAAVRGLCDVAVCAGVDALNEPFGYGHKGQACRHREHKRQVSQRAPLGKLHHMFIPISARCAQQEGKRVAHSTIVGVHVQCQCPSNNRPCFRRLGMGQPT